MYLIFIHLLVYVSYHSCTETCSICMRTIILESALFQQDIGPLCILVHWGCEFHSWDRLGLVWLGIIPWSGPGSKHVEYQNLRRPKNLAAMQKPIAHTTHPAVMVVMTQLVVCSMLSWRYDNSGSVKGCRHRWKLLLRGMCPCMNLKCKHSATCKCADEPQQNWVIAHHVYGH